jgi:hypothetical protein
MPIERVDFANARWQSLAALLELPDRKPVATALFGHRFTCGKDNLAAWRIAKTLAQRGRRGTRCQHVASARIGALPLARPLSATRSARVLRGVPTRASW